MIPVAKSVCDLWPTRSEEGRRCCVFCSTLFCVLCFVCSALQCATAATARLHARQGNRNLQTMVQLFTCYMVCWVSQCLLKEDAWPAGQQQSGVRLVGGARGREQSLKLQVGKTQRCGGQTPLRKVHLGLTKTIVTILV